MEKKKISTNPNKQTLACDQVITFDKQGKIKTEWKYEILKDWKPEID
jgi:hypothetical protein